MVLRMCLRVRGWRCESALTGYDAVMMEPLSEPKKAAPDATTGMSPSGRQGEPRVRSAARVVEILQLVARADAQGISATAIAERLGMPRQVVYHLAHTLIGMDMLRKARRGRYLLGIDAAIVAEGFHRQMRTTGLLESYAEKAAQATGETAHVVGWSGNQIVVLATAPGSASGRPSSIGSITAEMAQAHAGGRLLLAMARERDAESDAQVHDRGGGPRASDAAKTRTVPDEEFCRIRERRLSVEREECGSGLSSIAVPLGSPPSTMAIGVIGPAERVERHFEDYTERLRAISSGL